MPTLHYDREVIQDWTMYTYIYIFHNQYGVHQVLACIYTHTYRCGSQTTTLLHTYVRTYIHTYYVFTTARSSIGVIPYNGRFTRKVHTYIDKQV